MVIVKNIMLVAYMSCIQNQREEKVSNESQSAARRLSSSRSVDSSHQVRGTIDSFSTRSERTSLPNKLTRPIESRELSLFQS